MSDRLVSFSVNNYKFFISIRNHFKLDKITKLSLLRIKKLLRKNRYLRNYLKKKYGKIEILFPEGCSIIDEKIIIDILKTYSNRKVKLSIIGGISGSVPLSIIINSGTQKKRYFIFNQKISGVNFDTNRPLRKFLYNKLINNYKKILEMEFNEIIKFLKTKESINFFLRYGNKSIKIYNINKCPNCFSKNTIKLFHSEGNTIQGFLPNSNSLYDLCRECELVFSNKQVSKENLNIYYQNFAYERKKSIKNHIKLLKNLNEYNTSHFSNYLHSAKKIKKSKSILDLGSGNGEFVSLARKINKNTKISALDWFMPKNLKSALKSLNIIPYTSQISIESLRKLNLNKFDLITMWEVIEHFKIDDLKKILTYIKTLMTDDGYLILSTPDFDDPHCKSLDFWSMAAGEHLSVFNKNSIKNILNSTGYYVKNIEKESVTIKKANAWYDYGLKTNSSLAGRGSAQMIEQILKNKKLREQYKYLSRKNKIGSEMIIIAGKKP